MGNIIEINNLYKSFGEIRAVFDVSFKVKEGEFFAFLGVNGAGKSTTINIMCGQLKKDGGEVIINGNSLDDGIEPVKKTIGVVFQNSVLDKVLSVYDNLESRAALYGIVGDDFKKRLVELSKLFDLDEILKRPLGKLSGGQRRRVDIARALVHKPKILILDEPTTGLDPQTRKNIWSAIDKLRRENNMTVFLTTHYMEETADADYVVILDSGKIAAEGSPLELKNKYTVDYITVYTDNEKDILSLGVPYTPTKDGYRITVKNTGEATELIVKHPHVFVDYEITKGKMDDVFLNATGKLLTGVTNNE